MTTKPKRIRKPKITAKHRDARPTIYHDYWFDSLRLHLLAGWSIYRWCQNPKRPTYKTVMAWQADIPEFRDKLAHARAEAAEADVDRMGYIAEQVELGQIDPVAGRVAIQARRDMAGMRKPKKYGTRVEVGGGGRDGAILVQFAAEDEKLM